MEVRGRLEVSPLMDENVEFWKGSEKILVHRGGTRSGKSYSIAQFLVSLLFDTSITRTISVVRKTLPSLRASGYRDVMEVLEGTDLDGLPLVSYVRITKFPEIHISYAGNLLEFFSIDDEQKVRSRKRDVLWIQEGNEITKQEFDQLILRTKGKVFLDFNPDDENVWINTELEQRRKAELGDVRVVVSNYKHNTFLNDEERREIEYLEKSNPEAFRVFGLGEYGNVRGRIFNWNVSKFPDSATRVGIGLDFGFSIDPTAVVEVAKQDGKLHVRELLYERNLTNPDIVRRLALDKQELVIADSAEPKSIEEIRRSGQRIEGARKGPDSIRNSIDILKRFELVIDPGSTNLLKELRSYKWQTDRNGDAINKPVDFMNHAIDALRYVALNKLNTNKRGVYAVR